MQQTIDINSEGSLVNIQAALDEYGYCVVTNTLSTAEVDDCKKSFYDWKASFPNHDYWHKKISPHGIYKHHRVGHTRHAWKIRTNKNVLKVFGHLWKSDDLIVSYDGANYIPKEWLNKDTNWTHTDQAPKRSGLQCYQGFVALTSNQERTLVVYEGSHKLHKEYFENQKRGWNGEWETAKNPFLEKEQGKKPRDFLSVELSKLKKKFFSDKRTKEAKNWAKIDLEYLECIKGQRRALVIPAGSLVLWDSRVFHQNQFGKPGSEDRIVQYVSYLRRDRPLNTVSIQKKRQLYFDEQRTCSHWACPMYVNSLQPHTWGDTKLLIDYNKIPLNNLEDIEGVSNLI